MAHVFSSPWRTAAAVAVMSCCLLLAGDSGTVAGESTAVEESPPAPAAHDTAVANRLLQGVASPFVPNLGQWEHSAWFVHRAGAMAGVARD